MTNSTPKFHALPYPYKWHYTARWLAETHVWHVWRRCDTPTGVRRTSRPLAALEWRDQQRHRPPEFVEFAPLPEVQRQVVAASQNAISSISSHQRPQRRKWSQRRQTCRYCGAPLPADSRRTRQFCNSACRSAFAKRGTLSVQSNAIPRED